MQNINYYNLYSNATQNNLENAPDYEHPRHDFSNESILILNQAMPSGCQVGINSREMSAEFTIARGKLTRCIADFQKIINNPNYAFIRPVVNELITNYTNMANNISEKLDLVENAQNMPHASYWNLYTINCRAMPTYENIKKINIDNIFSKDSTRLKSLIVCRANMNLILEIKQNNINYKSDKLTSSLNQHNNAYNLLCNTNILPPKRYLEKLWDSLNRINFQLKQDVNSVSYPQQYDVSSAKDSLYKRPSVISRVGTNPFDYQKSNKCTIM